MVMMNTTMFEYLKKYVVNSPKEKNGLKNIFYKVSPEEIEKAENEMGKKFPSALKCFYQEIGYGFFDTETKDWLNLLMPPSQIADYYLARGNYEYSEDREFVKDEDFVFFERDCSAHIKLKTSGENEGKVFFGRKMIADSFELFVQKMAECSSFFEFESPFYDPQIEIRFDGKSKKENDLQNLIIKAAKEKQYAKVVEAYEANPDVEIKHLLENNIIAAYNNLDKYDEALEALDKFKARFENRMRIWYYFAGYAYVGKEDCEKAEECIKAGIDECNREKEANILIGTRYKNEVADFLYFQWQCQRIKALRLLKDRISSDSKLSEIIQVFKEMCQSKFEFEEGPLLLFEAYAGEGDSYTIHLVRQAEYLRYEEYYQLTADIEYNQEEVQKKAISEVFCNYNQDGDIFEYIGSSQAYNLLKDLKPSKFNIEEVDIEDCVSEKDIKLKTGGSLKENLTVNRKQVSNEEEIMALLNDDIVELEIGDHCLHIEFSEDGHAFIGWIDMYNDENYYFDNGSGNTESVDLIVNVCPEERMMCYDQDVLKEIVLYFCETGLRNPKYNWIEDTFE